VIVIDARLALGDHLEGAFEGHFCNEDIGVQA